VTAWTPAEGGRGPLPARPEEPTPAVAGEAFPPARRAWRLVVVLTALYALSLLDRQVIALLLDDIRKDLRISDFQVSLLQGISFALFYAVFGLAFGRAVDRLPRRRIVAVGVSIWSLAAAGCGLARNFLQLAGARFGVGAGEAALAPAAYSMIADSFPKARLALAMAVFGAGATLGNALSSAVGGLTLHLLPKAGVDLPLLGHLPAWRAVFLITGTPGLLLAWLIFLAPEPMRRGRKAGGPRPVGDTVAFLRSRWRFFVGHFFGFGLQSLCAYSLISWQAMYLHRRFGWDIPSIAAVLLVVSLVVAGTGQTLTGYLVDRWFRAGRTDACLRLFALAGIAQIGLVFCAVNAANPWVSVFFFGAWGMISNPTGPAAAAIQQIAPNEFRGQLSAAYILVFNLLGVGCGATIAGAFSTFLFRDDHMIGWAIFLTFAIFMPVAIACLVSAMKPMREAIAAAGGDG
jgi:MFS family permease